MTEKERNEEIPAERSESLFDEDGQPPESPRSDYPKAGGKGNDGEPPDQKIVARDITEELRTSYIDYAMSVIVGRAIPDVTDGLKPVQRRILYAMFKAGMMPDKAPSKCSAIVGNVMGLYHPHGDQAIYDALVRMSQSFNARYPLVTGQGNFGSMDGDPPAAQRYTEAKLSPEGLSLLEDIGKETVNFVPNYDGREEEPIVLPASLPNFLLNGTSGIAVGMSTDVPPHNLGEVIDGIIRLTDDPDVTIDDLMMLIPAPDFPTGGVISGLDDLKKAYEDGSGRLLLRGRATIEEPEKGKPGITILEIPYQINKAQLVKKIAELAKSKKIDGITEVRDESDRNGMRIVIDLRRDSNPRVILNNLYKQTSLQTSIPIHFLAIVEGIPRKLNLKQILEEYLKHRRKVVRRAKQYDLDRANERAHILEGIKVCLDNIDEVIAFIRGSDSPSEAKSGLIEKYALTEIQAQAILDMRLQALTQLERSKVEEELAELYKKIEELSSILADPKRIDGVIKEHLLSAKEKFGDSRRSGIQKDFEMISDEDLIPEEQVVITLTENGYVKRVPASIYRSQGRGGKGIRGHSIREEDRVLNLVSTSNHSHILAFTTDGMVYSLRAYDIPVFDRTAKGTPIVNLISMPADQRVKAILPLEDFAKPYVFFVTRRGTVKKCELSLFRKLRVTGKRAISIEEGDELRVVLPTSGKDQILIVTAKGLAVKFLEGEVRPMGTSAVGVIGVRAAQDDEIVDALTVRDDEQVLVVSQNGYGKKSEGGLFRETKRGAKGVIALRTAGKVGRVIGIRIVKDDDEFFLISKEGILIRQSVEAVSKQGRATQGVRLMKLNAGDSVSSVEVISDEE